MYLLRVAARIVSALAPTLLLATAASAGIIRGTLRVPAPGSAAPQLHGYAGSAGAMPGMHGPARGRATDAVVYVAQVPAAAESSLASAQGARPKLAQKNESFVPRVVPVRTSTTFKGDDWIGLKMRDASVVRGIGVLPIFAGLIGLLLLIGSLAATWAREGR